MSGLIEINAAIDAICDEFSEVYCNNCDHKSDDGDCCEECHRKYMNWAASRETVECVLKALPSAQPEERKRGKWILKPNIYGVAYCSECDYELHTNNTNFCPNCGTDMRDNKKEDGE